MSSMNSLCQEMQDRLNFANDKTIALLEQTDALREQRHVIFEEAPNGSTLCSLPLKKQNLTHSLCVCSFIVICVQSDRPSWRHSWIDLRFQSPRSPFFARPRWT